MRFQAGRRTAAAALVCALGLSPTLRAATDAAQPPAASRQAEEQKRTGLYKILAGLSAVGVGAILVANSHASESVTGTGIGTIQASATNTGAMISGIGMLGAGGVLIYLGVKDRSEADKRTHPSIGFTVGPRTTVFVTRRW